MESERQGSRWLYAAPSEEDIREWFSQQPLHDGMDHNKYVSGIVIISATDKTKVTREKNGGGTFIAEEERTVYVPYVKVDTRIAYFWDLVAQLNGGKLDGDYVGVIEPVAQLPHHDGPFANSHLPTGFSVLTLRNGDSETFNRYLVCTERVAIYRRESYEEAMKADKPEQAVPILSGEDSKQSKTSAKFADDNVVMKARTGAIGRALGVAGILVVGTGVATAEEMQEFMDRPASGAGAARQEQLGLPEVEHHGGERQPVGTGVATAEVAVEPPSDAEPVQQTPAQEDAALREHGRRLAKELHKDYPEAWAAHLAWHKERHGDAGLDKLSGPVLKGTITKLERDLDLARQNDEPKPE